MSWLTDWLQTIVVFILFATIIELLLPNSNMQRYVKMIVSMLLLMLILQPLMAIFSKDLTDFIPNLASADVVNEKHLKNSIEAKKIDIESEQRAYISEQVAVQLKRQVEEELRNEFQVEIESLTLTLDEEQIRAQISEAIKQVTVYVRSNNKNNSNRAIEPVDLISIHTSEPLAVKEDNNTVQTKQVQEHLAETWLIPKEIIVLVWEGGK